jgi:hypothetical protein
MHHQVNAVIKLHGSHLLEESDHYLETLLIEEIKTFVFCFILLYCIVTLHIFNELVNYNIFIIKEV